MTGPLLVAAPAGPKPAAVAPARRPAPLALAPPAPPPVLTYLRLHWLLIAFCGALLGGPAAYAAWTLMPAKYVSSALLQIESNPLAVAGSDPGRSGVTAFDTYVKTQRKLITSDLSLNAALNDPTYGISRLLTLAEQRDPIKYLKESVVVEGTGSELLEISLEGKRPDDVRKIVDAVLAAYLKECVQDDTRRRTGFKQKLDLLKTGLEKDLKDRLNPAAPATFPGDVSTDPLVQQASGAKPAGAVVRAAAESPAVRNLMFGDAAGRLLELRRERDRLPGKLAKLQAESTELSGQYEALKKAEPLPEVAAVLDRDPEVQQYKQVAEGMWAKYRQRAANSPRGTASQYVQSLRADAEAADAAAAKLRAEKFEALVRQAKGSEAQRIVARLNTLQPELLALKEREKELPKLLEAAERDMTDNVPPDVQQAGATGKGPLVDPQATELTTYGSMYARMADQTLRLRIELESPARVQVRQPASAPSLRDSKKQVMATVVAGLLGFGLVAAGAVLAEVRAKRVCSLAEVQAASLAPVVGVIPAIPVGNDPVGRAAAAEALDKLRSRVAQTFLARGATTVAVTSPLGDEGKAVTAFGLANSLALAGYKTLLLDFDLRTPALHQHAGVPNQDGVCELLAGDLDPRRAMIVLANDLHFVPAGAFSEAARAAAVGSRLTSLLRTLGEAFDCVVLHGHALLAAAEAVEVARRADAVLLCGTYRDTRLPLLKRAVDRLAVMEVPHVGAVYLGATTHEALC